jgi:hypothetical protein
MLSKILQYQDPMDHETSPRGHWCINCHLQNYWIGHGHADCFNLHPEDAPVHRNPWTFKKTLQLSTVCMLCGSGKPLVGSMLPHPRYPCEYKFCETPERYLSWRGCGSTGAGEEPATVGGVAGFEFLSGAAIVG